VQGKKWVVEYVEGNPNLEIQTTETNQSVYIYRCVGSTIHIQEKGAWRKENIRVPVRWAYHVILHAVLRIRDVYPGFRTLIFIHPVSRIQEQQPKRGKIFLSYLFAATNITKLKFNFLLGR
jgi:hypothetical protein